MDVIGFFISLFSLSVFVILLLFITELFLFPKVESCIYTDSSESISEGEVLFSIVDVYKRQGLNAYWIFNYKKFSYPAAYSQSTNQRKSAGSLMAGFSYSQHNISFDYEKLPGEVRVQLHDALLFKKVKYSDYSINVGYGYNRCV